MKKISIIFALMMVSTSVFAQESDLPPLVEIPEIGPTSFGDVADKIFNNESKDAVLFDEIPKDDPLDQTIESENRLSLFSSSEGEDENILEIKKIARNLETQRAMMNHVANLQAELISWANSDPSAAYHSRYPFSICQIVLEDRFCHKMEYSFKKEGM